METPATSPDVTAEFNGSPDLDSPIFWLEHALHAGLYAQACERAAFNSRNRRTAHSEPLYFGACALAAEAQRKWDRYCGREPAHV